MKSVINNVMAGLGFGFLTVTICLNLMIEPSYTLTQFTAWMIASILYGLATFIFEFEIVGPKITILIHFIACLLITLGTGLYLGYGDGLIGTIKNMLFIFCVIYVIIYASSYFYCKSSAKQINEKLMKNE